MTKQVQRRRGTSTQHTSFTGAEGEISVNTTNKSIHVHDGSTAGGVEAARADLTNVSDANLNAALAGNTLSSLTITSVDINGGTIDGAVIGGSSAAAGTFTTVTASGDVTIADKIMHSGDTNTAIRFPAADTVTVETSGAERLRITSAGLVGIGTASPGAILELNAGTNSDIRVNTSASGYLQLGQFSNGAFIATSSTDATAGILRLGTGGSENMRISVAGNVGIGTTSPVYKLVVSAAGASGIEFGPAYSGTANLIQHYSRSGGVYVDAVNDAAQHRFATSGSERMRIDSSGNVGIGTSSPGYKLDVRGGIIAAGNGTIVGGISYSTRPEMGAISNHDLGFITNNTTQMLLTTSGNLGLGVTPSAWNANAKVLETGSGGLYSFTTIDTEVFQNCYLGASNWTYKNNGFANRYSQYNGQHLWYNAPSGTAGNAITFTQAMTLDASGNLGIGTTSPTDIGGYKSVSLNGSSGSLVDSYFNGTLTGRVQAWSGGYFISAQGASTPLVFGTNNTERARIDSSGNLGLGVTPSAWSTLYSQKAFQFGPVGSLMSLQASTTNNQTYVNSNAVNLSGGWTYMYSDFATQYRQYAGTHAWSTAPSGTAGNAITFTQAMTLDASGNLFVGGTTGTAKLNIENSVSTAYSATNTLAATPVAYFYNSNGTAGTAGTIRLDGGTSGGNAATSISAVHVGSGSSALTFGTRLSNSDVTERARIDSSGNFLVGKTTTSGTALGFFTTFDGLTGTVVGTGAGYAYYANRQNDDGVLITLRQANTQEGSISVSGTTVSYNGGHLSRWAQTIGPKDDTLVKGTVLSNLDEMNAYTDADGNHVDNEQLNKVKVSDVEGDANVAGVFVNWTYDDQHNVDEINMAMTGDMVIRIGAGVTVARGDLLMSAGDGTAKPQGDDIVRSKTIAKVTSTHVSHTYADGSYAVPCVLMAC